MGSCLNFCQEQGPANPQDEDPAHKPHSDPQPPPEGEKISSPAPSRKNSDLQMVVTPSQEVQSINRNISVKVQQCRNLQDQKKQASKELNNQQASHSNLLYKRQGLQKQLQETALKTTLIQKWEKKDRQARKLSLLKEELLTRMDTFSIENAPQAQSFENCKKIVLAKERTLSCIEEQELLLQKQLSKEQFAYPTPVELEQQMSQLLNRADSVGQMILKAQSEEKQILEQLQKTRSEYFSIEQIFKQKVKEVEKVKAEISRKQSTIVKKYKQNAHQNNKQRNIKGFFVGEVLQREQDMKEFLISSLEERINSKVKGTRLVYRWDPKNKVNFHKYIDKVKHIVVIVRLINGYTIAAWSEGGFSPSTTPSHDGLLLSLTNKKVFRLLQVNHRAVAYDDFFLIFGNSELRLKTGEKGVFSNFGVQNAFYNCQGEKVSTLLGAGTEREVDLLNYEIFSLKLH